MSAAAHLAEVVRSSSEPEQAIRNLFAVYESTDPDSERECGCGWTVYFVIDHSTLEVCDRWCSGHDCGGSWAGPLSQHDVLELLDATCIGCPECTDAPIDPEEEHAARLDYESAVRKGW